MNKDLVCFKLKIMIFPLHNYKIRRFIFLNLNKINKKILKNNNITLRNRKS